MILIATLTMMLTIALFSMGIIRIALLQGHMSQALVDHVVGKQAHASMLAQLVREGTTDIGSTNWFIQAQTRDMDLCLTSKGGIDTHCTDTYDPHQDIRVTATLRFLNHQQAQHLFSCMITVIRATTHHLLQQKTYRIIVTGFPDTTSIQIQ